MCCSLAQSCLTLCNPMDGSSRLPCPSPTPGVYSNSCPSSRWCHPAISSSVVPFSSRLQSFLASWVFSNESVLQWPEYWSFSFSIRPSNEYSGLISFRFDRFDLLAVKGLSRVFSNTTAGKYPFLGTRQWHPTPVLLPGKSPGWRNLVGCSPWDRGRVGHDWATSLSLFTFMHWRRKWQPTPVFLPGESQGRGSLVGCRLWGCTESNTTEVT